jgi:hypothetical protein
MAIPRRFTIAGGIIGAIAVALVGLILRPVLSANSVLDDIRKIDRSHFDANQLREWARRGHGTAVCSEQRCEAEVQILNRLLYALRLAPLTRFNVDFVVIDNRLVQTSLVFSDVQYLGKATGATTRAVIVWEPSKSFDFPGGEWFVGHGPIGKAPSVFYVVSPQSGSRALTIAQAINVWCLARIGGCSPSEQAPDIWSLPETPIKPGASQLWPEPIRQTSDNR